MNYSSIELFAGCGGMALGLKYAGIKNELLVEINKDAVETMKLNKPKWNIVKSDIKKIDFTLYRDQIDILTGGFPCQPFSIIGQRKGLEDTKGTLFYELARAIKESNSKIFLAENVQNLVYHDNGRTLEVILNTFNELNYRIAYKVLDAVDYDVPQYRKRIFIIGVRKDLGLNNIYFPVNKHKKKITLGEAIIDNPIDEKEENIGFEYSDRLKHIMQYIPNNGGKYDNLPIEIRKQIKATKSTNYLERKSLHAYHKLNSHKPSTTLTCKPSSNYSFKGHPYKLRYLNIREYARLQTFPDAYKFVGSISSQYRQIGNAVAVNMARFLGYALIKTLEQNNNKTFEFEKDCNFVCVDSYQQQLSLFD